MYSASKSRIQNSTLRGPDTIRFYPYHFHVLRDPVLRAHDQGDVGITLRTRDVIAYSL